MQLEFGSGSIYACFEEAVSEYSQQINHYNTKNWMWDNYGNTTKVSSSNRTGTGSTEPQKPNMGSSIFLSDKYGDWILYKPPFKSNSYALWILPYLIFVFGIFILFLILRKNSEGRK